MPFRSGNSKGLTIETCLGLVPKIKLNPLCDNLGRDCLKYTHDLTSCSPWSDQNKPVDLIKHQLLSQNLLTMLLCNFLEKFFETISKRVKSLLDRISDGDTDEFLFMEIWTFPTQLPGFLKEVIQQEDRDI